MRAAVVTAAAISEAQNDILAKFDRSVFLSVIVWQIQMLSLILHELFSEGVSMQLRLVSVD